MYWVGFFLPPSQKWEWKLTAQMTSFHYLLYYFHSRDTNKAVLTHTPFGKLSIILMWVYFGDAIQRGLSSLAHGPSAPQAPIPSPPTHPFIMHRCSQAFSWDIPVTRLALGIWVTKIYGPCLPRGQVQSKSLLQSHVLGGIFILKSL